MRVTIVVAMLTNNTAMKSSTISQAPVNMSKVIKQVPLNVLETVLFVAIDLSRNGVKHEKPDVT